MAKNVIMPALGMAQETGVLLQWLKAEGDSVEKGELLMEIETDKATVEVEAPASGTLVNITAQPGDEIPVGQVIAVIVAPSETVSQTSKVLETSDVLSVSPTEARGDVLASPLAARIAAEHDIDLRQIGAAGSRIQKEDVLAYLEKQGSKDTQTQGSKNGQTLASPKARRLAREQNLALAEINGSGPEGAVLAADVLAAAKAAQAKPVPTPVPVPQSEPTPASETQTLPMSRTWRVMVDRLSQSWASVPHFYLTTEANATRLMAWRENALERATEKITITDLLVKLVAAALRRHPRLNAMWQNESIVLNEAVNVGLAVAVEEGLVVPVIHQADQVGLNGLAAQRKALVERAQAGKLSLEDITRGTFTISNLGMFGIDSFNAIVNPPQAAILAVGRIADRVVPLNGQPAIQPMINLTLSCDHRVVDGARGAQFLQTLVKFIEDPLAVLD